MTDFSNNNYKWFETLEETEENYSKFMESKKTNEMVPEVAHQIRHSRIKDFITIVLLIVIVKLLFFQLHIRTKVTIPGLMWATKHGVFASIDTKRNAFNIK